MKTLILLKLYMVAFIQLHYILVEATTTISHPRVTSVCSGDQLELICTTTTGLLQWILHVPENSTVKIYDRALSTASRASQIQINSTRLTFSRISAINDLPLVSRLLISPVSDSLNGTEVNCADDGSSSSIIINIISRSLNLDPQESNISIILEQFESDGVTAILDLTRQNSLYSSSVSITPDISLWINGSANINLKLKVPYNTVYNVNVATMSPCGGSTVTSFTELSYSRVYAICDNPVDQSEIARAVHIAVIGINMFPVLNGTNVTFSCPPGLVLSGPSSTVCMENGGWEPDPKEVECKTAVDIDVQQSFTLSQNGKIAVTSLTASIITSTFFFITGLMCGHYCRKQKHSCDCPNCQPPAREHIPSHNDPAQEEELEMQENASYASLH